MSRVVTIKIGGDAVTIDLSTELEIHDPDAERHKVASDVAWWGTIAARANAVAESHANAAEHWKNAAIKACVESDEKMAEWKAKAQAAGHPKYLEILREVARARETADMAASIHWSFIRKMDMLRAMIAGEAGTQRSSNEVGRLALPEPKDPSGKSDPRLDSFKKKRRGDTSQET